MTHASEAARAGRAPLQIVEIDCDLCQYLYGSLTTNRIYASEGFDNPGQWVISPNSEIFPGVTRSPRGDFTGFLLQARDIDDAYIGQRRGTFTGLNTYASMFVKFHSAYIPYLGLYDATAGAWASLVRWEWKAGGGGGELYDSAGTVVARGAREWSDGWWQIWLVTDTVASGHIRDYYFYGDHLGAAAGQGTYCWGAMIGESLGYMPYVQTLQTENTHGCTATGSTGEECYNTRATCQVAENYRALRKTYRFSERLIDCAPPGVPMIPSVVSISQAPAKLEPGISLGYRASVTSVIADHTHHDRDIDPYADTRAVDPATRGTFWTKFLARNVYFLNRPIRVRTGYITDPWDWSNFENQEYVIDRIDGPDSSEQVRIVGKDILKLADNARIQVPRATRAELTFALDANQTSAYVSPYYAYNLFDSWSGYARIDDEIVGYTFTGSDATGTGVILARGTWGTTAAAHDAGAQMQQCLAAEGINVVSFLRNLLIDYAGIGAPFIDEINWQALEANRLAVYRLTGIKSEPGGLSDVLSELLQQCQIALWWDEVDKLLKLRELTLVETEFAALTDQKHIIAGSVSLQLQADLKRSQVWFYYTPADPTETKLSNYRRLYIQSDTDIEGAEKDGDVRAEIIEARWLTNNTPAVAQSAIRLLNRRSPAPRRLMLSVDAKDMDELRLGSIVEIQTRYYTDAAGDPLAFRGMIVLVDETQGSQVKLEILGGFGQVAGTIVTRPIIIGPNTLLDYSAESAANKLNYSFISPTDTEFSDGTDAYRIT